MDLVQSLDLMSDIHSTITTTSGCLFYQLVSFAFEVNLRKSVQISLIAVSGSAHKDRLKQCHVRRPLLVYGRFNKIATQGAPQMAVDKEANSLSRVYSYYSKFNLRLFYV